MSQCVQGDAVLTPDVDKIAADMGATSLDGAPKANAADGKDGTAEAGAPKAKASDGKDISPNDGASKAKFSNADDGAVADVSQKAHPRFLPFKQALEYARSLKLKNEKGWVAWYKSKERPSNIPSAPHKIYKHDGWQGLRHWLGTGTRVGGSDRTAKAKDGAPKANASDAKDGAVADGSQKAYRRFLPFKQALEYARSLNLKGQAAWVMWTKSKDRPSNIPSAPHIIYKHDGWQGVKHWLGTGTRVGGKDGTPKAKGGKDGTPKAKDGKDGTPKAKDGTPNDGTDNRFLPFKQALEYACSLKLKGKSAWQTWSNSEDRPANIPSTPHATYRHEGWQGYGHWLGTGNRRTPKDGAPKGKASGGKGDTPKDGTPKANASDAKNDVVADVSQKTQPRFLPFEKALEYARSLELNGSKEWAEWCKVGARPVNIPTNPQKTYKHDGWQGYAHWLDTDNFQARKEEYLPFADALLYARSLEFKTPKEWEAWCKTDARPSTMPTHPRRTYKHDGWQDIQHWLGTTGRVGDNNGTPKAKDGAPTPKASDVTEEADSTPSSKDGASTLKAPDVTEEADSTPSSKDGASTLKASDVTEEADSTPTSKDGASTLKASDVTEEADSTPTSKDGASTLKAPDATEEADRTGRPQMPLGLDGIAGAVSAPQ